MPRCILMLIISFPLFFTPFSGWTQTKDEPSQNARQKAEKLFKNAEVHYNVGDFDAALKDYKEAYLLSTEPALLFNMAQCYRHLGALEEAKRTYKNFLKEVPDSILREDVEKLLLQLKQEIAQAQPKPEMVSTKPAASFTETPAKETSKTSLTPVENTTPTSTALDTNAKPPTLKQPQKSRTILIVAVIGGAIVGGVALAAIIGRPPPPPPGP